MIDRLRTRLRRDDDGTTLIELVVGMSIMTIFMAMFTGALFLMTSDTNKTEAMVTAEQQSNQAYLWLDRNIRYASAVTAPGKSATNNWYVEFSVPGTNGTSTCYQLRVNTAAQQLQQRSWAVSSTGTGGTATTWLPLSNSVSNGGAAVGAANVPFSLVTAATSQNQQIRIQIATSQVGAATASSALDVTFTALNSVSDYQKTPPSVCTQQGARP